MAVEIGQFITSEAFDAFANNYEHGDRLFEWVMGQLVEVPLYFYPSVVASNFIVPVMGYVRQHQLGHMTGGGCGYMVNGDCYLPQIAFISYERMPELPRENGFVLIAPDFVVEVVLDATDPVLLTRLRRKLANYLFAGVLVWLVDPFTFTE